MEELVEILASIGEKYCCDRVYIFEFENNLMHNTYEWCASGVYRQKEILNNLPVSEIDWWMESFNENKELVIQDLEEIKMSHPTVYAALKPQDIKRLAVVALVDHNRIIGFWGVDNPENPDCAGVVSALKTMGYYAVLLLRQRDLQKRIDRLKNRDDVTGAYNRTVLSEYLSELSDAQSLGVLQFDIGYEKINGRERDPEAENRAARMCCDFIIRELGTGSLYCIRENIYAAFFTDISEFDFMKKANALENRIKKADLKIVVGYAWSDYQPVNVKKLFGQADEVMYCRMQKGIFYKYLDQCHFDQLLFMESLSCQNETGYFFFGDMRKDIFFISDNLKKDFGFQGQMVYGFLTEWEKRILTEKDKDTYRRDHENMIINRSGIHDLRYRVRDIYGKNVWIHCFGILKWNEDTSEPLFFSGRITRQDNHFVVDPITNFPRTTVMLQRIKEMEKRHHTVRTIGFSLNAITEINSCSGRVYADQMVKMITQELVNELSGQMTFYRLDGMRCVAVIEHECAERKEILIEKIRKIIVRWYRIMGICADQPCSFGYMETSGADMPPEEFLEHMVFLIKLAKHGRSSSYEEYSDKNIPAIKRMSKIKLALNRDVMNGMQNFRIVIQPIVSCKKGEIEGGEVLLRWQYENEDISPNIFIPLLEKTNMIYTVGKWVFEQAAYVCIRLHSYDEHFFLTFNISIRQLADAHLVNDMRKILEKYRLSGTHLIAEITENFMDELPGKMMEFSRQCNEMGIRIAMDDFGNGYSSLRRLLQYPSVVIKLDRTLLEEIMDSAEKKKFMESIVYACHRFGKEVCMEGVETAEQDELVRNMGCDMIQGYFYYKPMALDELYKLLSSLQGINTDEQ